MPQKTFHMEPNGLEHPSYVDPNLSVLRLEHHLEEYPSGEIPCHWHPEFLFALVLRGRVGYLYYQGPEDPVEYELEEGDGVFINSRVVHGCRQLTPGARVFVFGMLPNVVATPLFGTLFQKKILPLVNSKVMGLHLSNQREDDHSILDLFRAYYQITPQDRDYELRSVAMLCEIWIMLFHKLEDTGHLWMRQGFDTASAELVQPMIRYIVDNYDKPVLVEQIAQAGGVSKRECYRRFRTILGRTPLEFLNYHRLNVAFHQLSTTSRTVSQVSEACGFCTPGYFTKLFKKRFGIPPGHVHRHSSTVLCGIPDDPWSAAQQFSSGGRCD